MMKRFVAVMILLALVLPFSVAVLAQDDTNVLRYPITTDPEHLNPFISDTIAIGTVTRNIFESLTRYNAETGEVEPALAESWAITTNDEGQQVYTFDLREGVLFHDVAGVEYDSREVTADDVMWNYMVALNADEEISIRSADASLLSILGAEEYVTEMEAMIEAGDDVPLVMDMEVSGLQVVDDYTFQITLARPDRLFLINGMVSIMSPEAYEQLGEDINNIAVGTGPYQFVEWLRDDRLILEANPDYYVEGLPMNDGIRFINYPDANTALLDYREGNLDFLFSFPSGQRAAIISEFSDEFNEKPGLHVRYWGFNMETGFLSEQPLVRKALSHALDRTTAWEVFEEGARFPATQGFLPPAMPASTAATTYDFDLDAARALLDEAGFPATGEPLVDGGDGLREDLPVMRIHLLEVISGEAQVVVWEAALKELGIQVEFIVEDGGTYWDSIVEDDAMIFQNGWAAGLIDPSDVFDFLIYQGNGSMRYDNPVINDLLDQARVELDAEAREALYQQVHDIVMDDAVVIPSAFSKVSWLQAPGISGFVPGGGGTYTAPLWNVTMDGM